MDIIYNPVFLEHDTASHPESGKRLECLGELATTEIENGEQYIGLVHKRDYIDKVKHTKGEFLDPDTRISKGSYNTAIHAVGATVMASETGSFALARPPGHHAHPDHSSGFCIFNNIAIASQKLVKEGKRVLIFDFDGHLGDGTLRFFYNTNKVLYWSIHQHPAFPGNGTADEIGEGKGKGYSINVPLPPKSGDDIYRIAIERFLPYAKQFKPDITALSAGFDAHQYDPLLALRATTNTFHSIGRTIKENFQNAFAVLEGGYNLEMLPKCVYAFLDGMNGNPLKYSEEETDSSIQTIDEAQQRMDRLEKNLSEHWKT